MLKQKHRQQNEEESSREFSESSHPFTSEVSEENVEQSDSSVNVIDNAVSLEERRSTENNEEEEEEIEESSGRGEEMGGTESIQRINHRKLLKAELQNNKKLEETLFCENRKNNYKNELIAKLKRQNQLVRMKLVKEESKVTEYRNRIKEIEGKMELMSKAKIKKSSEAQQRQLNWRKKQERILRQENHKYSQFVEALSESLLIVNGKKPNGMKKVWLQWKKILQQMNLYRSKYGKLS